MSTNNCINCEHFSELDIGHCYMFREEPDDRCMQFILVAPLNVQAQDVPQDKPKLNGRPDSPPQIYKHGRLKSHKEMIEDGTAHPDLEKNLAMHAANKAVPIKQSTIDEIVECLGLSSINVYILASNNLISTPEWDEEVRGIDKLIKELKDK